MRSLQTGPGGLGLRLFAVRLGKIFSNLSVVGLVCSLCGILAFAATAMIFLVGLIIIVMTLGLIFAMVPGFFDKLMSVMQVSAEISTFFLKNFSYFAALAIGGAVVSFLLLLTDKSVRHTGRLVLSGLVIVFTLIAIFVVVGGGGR